MLDNDNYQLYNDFMSTKNELTPQVLELMEDDLRKMREERRQIIIRQLSEGMTQREVAKYWKLDPARVYRIVNQEDK